MEFNIGPDWNGKINQLKTSESVDSFRLSVQTRGSGWNGGVKFIYTMIMNVGLVETRGKFDELSKQSEPVGSEPGYD